MLAHVVRHGSREGPEQVIGDQGPALGGDPGGRPQRIESGQGALANPGAIDGEQLGNLVVAAPAA